VKIRRPTPSMAIALVALFFALGGIGTAATTAIVPLAKRALSADNAKKLEKKTLRQVAAMPGPAAATTVTAPLTLAPSQEGYFAVSCDEGMSAISGGYGTQGVVLGLDTLPVTSNSWAQYLVNLSTTASAAVTLYVVCMDVVNEDGAARAPALRDKSAKNVLPLLSARARIG
jgi:hypothetical protein